MDINGELKKYFGFDSFRKGQKEVISRVLQGRSSAAIFPTGAGKSLCYQLPALMLPHMTLVVSPLLSLMKDQLDFLLSFNIKAARLDSSLKNDEYNRIINDAKEGNLKILMISVERFKNERFRTHLANMNISLLVVDEAHCISEWGHNFRPEYLRLPEYQREFAIEQSLLLTATATAEVTADMGSKFNISPEDIITTGFYRKNLYLKMTSIDGNKKRKKLLEDLSQNPGESTIVYVTLQKTAENTAEFLASNGLNASPYHGGMKNEERVDIQNRFMEGSLKCVVATIAFGMGIDKDNIRRVIHYNLPKSIENYSQEIGRSGRDGNRSVCEVYGDKGNLPILENFVYGDTPEKDSITIVLKEIQSGEKTWETKLTGLSKDSNIRVLPLKTLLVYLSMKKIIKPKYTFFEEYVFKYLLEPSQIIEQFEGERKTFVEVIINNCNSKKVWTSVDIESVCLQYSTDRQRVLKALDYFEEKQWIDLSARQAVEVYDVLDNSFDLKNLSEELYSLFKEKEATEIKRIHNMISFFENSSCYSRELAAYFGEQLNMEKCGHCSACESGSALLSGNNIDKVIPEIDIDKTRREIQSALKSDISEINLTRFLCGINSPIFNRLKIKKSAGFGSLEKYSFLDVKNRVKLIYNESKS